MNAHTVIGGRKKKGRLVFQFPLFYFWFLLVRLVPKVFCCDAEHKTEQFTLSKKHVSQTFFSRTSFSPVGVSNLIRKENVGVVLLPFLKQTKNAVQSSLYSSPTPTTMLWLSVELGQCYYQPSKK